MTPQHWVFEVQAEDTGTRLDKYLVAQRPELSRSQVQRLIQEGWVGLAQGTATASYRVRGGETIRLHIPPARPLQAPSARQATLQRAVHESCARAVLHSMPGE